MKVVIDDVEFVPREEIPENARGILDLKVSGDEADKTFREYFRDLLLTLWREGEGFSGKRPFGNSGWDYDLYIPLVKAGLVKGEFDEFGYLDELDQTHANELIEGAIMEMCKVKP